MQKIIYIDRTTRKQEIEQVYGASALELLYGDNVLTRIFGRPLRFFAAETTIISYLYGWWQSQRWTVRKIRPFIEKFQVDPSEFLDNVDDFRSFNDFFIRKLKPSARPIVQGDHIAAMPADGRYWFYQDISKADGFIVKGRKFNIASLLEDPLQAFRYVSGAMVLARLCPSDYHRFHFPCDAIPGPSRLINGWLYSVNPIAIKRNVDIYTQNKRMVCELDSEQFGKVLFLEIGATNVGSINQTYTPNQKCSKGAEKGFFAFGGSALILLFEPGRIVFDQDLLQASEQGFEIKCLMGQSLGRSL